MWYFYLTSNKQRNQVLLYPALMSTDPPGTSLRHFSVSSAANLFFKEAEKFHCFISCDPSEVWEDDSRR